MHAVSAQLMQQALMCRMGVFKLYCNEDLTEQEQLSITPGVMTN